MRAVFALIGFSAPLATGLTVPAEWAEWLSWVAGVLVAVAVAVDRFVFALRRGGAGVVLPESKIPRAVAVPPLSCPLNAETYCVVGTAGKREIAALKAAEAAELPHADRS